MLEISLSVEVLRLDVRNSLVQGTRYHQHVAREELVLLNLYEATNLHVEGLHLPEAGFTTRTTLHDRVVLLIVLLTPLVVFKGVLDHGDTNDEHEGHERGGCTVKVL